VSECPRCKYFLLKYFALSVQQNTSVLVNYSIHLVFIFGAQVYKLKTVDGPTKDKHFTCATVVRGRKIVSERVINLKCARTVHVNMDRVN
jgi:hypothetical protein